MAQPTRKTEHNGYDEVTINLSIPHFKKLYELAKSASKKKILEENFSLGKNKWGFHLEEKGEEDVRIFLYFFGTDCVTTEYSVYLKSSEGKFISTINLGLHKYAPKGSNIQGVTDSWGLLSWKTLSELQNEGFLSEGTLQLKFVLTVYSGNALLKMQAFRDLNKGVESGVGSDVTFIFVEEEGSKTVIDKKKAHKAILSLRSSVFATMFGSGMKEATDGEVEISDMTPKAFGILLNYIYSGEVDEEWDSVAEELLYGAEKYDLQLLLTFLLDNVEPVLTLKNVMKIRDFAKLKELPEVLELTKKFIKENIEGFLEKHAIMFSDD